MATRRATETDAAWIAPLLADALTALFAALGRPTPATPPEELVRAAVSSPTSESWVDDVSHYWCHLDYWPHDDTVQVSYLLPGQGQAASTRAALAKLLATALLSMDAALSAAGNNRDILFWADLDSTTALAHWRAVFPRATVTTNPIGGHIELPRSEVMRVARRL